uniref:Major facilitator superfamily (MFS) profile domain-containing protein n=1 Tax=Panagrolaimus sp. JU765 TaxID=591449 RepID=A0AC34R2X3_9BILA
MTWITFAPISYHTKNFYDNSNAPMFYNAVFMVVSIPVGFIAMWTLDKFGVRSGCLLGSFVNLAGNLLRVLGSIPSIHPSTRFFIVLLGQTIAAGAQPFILFLPTKLAAFWFPENQRAIANTIGSMSNPLGIAAMYASSSLFVNDSHPDAFLLLTSFVAAVALIPAVLSLGVTSSIPPTPASASTAQDEPSLPFSQGMKRALKSKSFLILAVSLGGGVGLFNALYNNLQPALCVKGYSDTFSGIMGALLILSGLFGSALSGIYVDKTKKFEQTMKCCFCVAGLCASSLTISLQHENVEWWIALSIFGFGAFGFAIYPIGLELGVEVTYPVAEATSSGLLIMIGQIQGVIYVFLTFIFTRQASLHEMKIQTCSSSTDPNDVQNWLYAFIAWNGVIAVLIILFVSLFWPKYKRMQYEQGKSRQNNAEMEFDSDRIVVA